MMRSVLFFLMILPASLLAQEPNGWSGKDVYIVPLETRMIRSQIDKELIATTELEAEEYYQSLSDALTLGLMNELGSLCNTRISSIHDTLMETPALPYIYRHIGYEYTPVEEKKEEEDRKLRLPFGRKKEEQSEDPGARIRNGEVVAQVDNREKFMRTVPTRDELLKEICNGLNVDRVFFISELDLSMVIPSDNQGIMDRCITLHFTVLEKSGKKVVAGKIRHYYASAYGDYENVVDKEFPALIEALVKKISFVGASH